MKKVIKILHVNLFLDIGGLEKVIVELCRRTNREEFSVEILCLQGYDPEYCREVMEMGIPVHVMKKRHRFDFRYFFEVAGFIRKCGIDVVHAHSGCFFYAVLFARLAGVRNFVYTAHGLPVNNGIKDYLEDNVAAALADVIVPVSKELCTVLAKRMPFSKKRLIPIINGIDTELFQPQCDEDSRRTSSEKYGLSPDVIWIGSVGRLEPVKNYSMLLKAFAILKKRSSRPVGLVLVGDGEERTRLEVLAQNLGIESEVRFLGMQYMVHEILPLFTVFALTSLTEGTSVSLLEAFACGVPAVVTRVGGNVDIIANGENGYLCETGDEIGMAELLTQLVSDPPLLSRLGENGRSMVTRRYALGTMVSAYEKLYKGLR